MGLVYQTLGGGGKLISFLAGKPLGFWLTGSLAYRISGLLDLWLTGSLAY